MHFNVFNKIYQIKKVTLRSRIAFTVIQSYRFLFGL